MYLVPAVDHKAKDSHHMCLPTPCGPACCYWSHHIMLEFEAPKGLLWVSVVGWLCTVIFVSNPNYSVKGCVVLPLGLGQFRCFMGFITEGGLVLTVSRGGENSKIIMSSFDFKPMFLSFRKYLVSHSPSPASLYTLRWS